METDKVIDIRHLSKVYKLYDKPMDRLKEAIHPRGKKYHKSFFAIKDITFAIMPGEVVGIIGKNGSGKSTLLKMLTGVLTPSSGNIDVHGKVSALLELGAGFNPEFTGVENIFFYGTIMGYSKSMVQDRVEAIIEFADIGDFIYQQVKTYSSGMFVRLAFAVAVAIEPEILIIDEALAVGDLRFQQKAIRKMQALMDHAKAILFVSHDMRSIRTFCNRAIWLMDGQIFRDGDVKEVTRQYEDYMEHGILPKHPLDNHEANEAVTSTINSTITDTIILSVNRKKSAIVWQGLPTCNFLGGEKAAFTNLSMQVNDKLYHGEELCGNETLHIYAQLTTRLLIKEPLFGFGVFNDKGMAIVHFNNDTICTEKIFEIAAPGVFEVEWKVPLPNLSNGTYSLSLGLDTGKLEESQVVHHLQECFLFYVNRQDCYSRQYGIVINEQATMRLL